MEEGKRKEYVRDWYKRTITDEKRARRRERYKNMTPEQKVKYAETDRKWKEANKDRLIECRKIRESIPGYREKERVYRIKNKEKGLLRDAKRRAKRDGLVFDLVFDDIIIPDICPVLGIPILKDGTAQNKKNSPSIDRVDNSKGYVKENIQVISWRANHIKNDSTLDELRKVLKYVEKNIH